MNAGVPSRPVDIADPGLHWQAMDTALPEAGSAAQWLAAPGSLTRLLKLASNNNFQVQVQAEAWEEIANSELRQQFGPLAAEHRFWSRRVVLLGAGEPWVQAHTLMPEHSLMSPLKQVLELGSRPLGEFLFEHPDLLRSHYEVARHSARTWGRRSLFLLYQKPIMVAEFFLPALMEHAVPE
jgi:chorismate--pyruvate lyase